MKVSAPLRNGNESKATVRNSLRTLCRQSPEIFSVLLCVTSPTALFVVMSMMSLSSNVVRMSITNPSAVSCADPQTGCLTSRLEAMDMKPNFIKKIKDSGLRYLPEAA